MEDHIWEAISTLSPCHHAKEMYPASYDLIRIDARTSALENEDEFVENLRRQVNPMKLKILIQVRNWVQAVDIRTFIPNWHLGKRNTRTIELLMMGNGIACRDGDIDLPAPFSKVMIGINPSTLYLVAPRAKADVAKLYARNHLAGLLREWIPDPAVDLTSIEIFADPLRDRFSKFKIGQAAHYPQPLNSDIQQQDRNPRNQVSYYGIAEESSQNAGPVATRRVNNNPTVATPAQPHATGVDSGMNTSRAASTADQPDMGMDVDQPQQTPNAPEADQATAVAESPVDEIEISKTLPPQGHPDNNSPEALSSLSSHTAAIDRNLETLITKQSGMLDLLEKIAKTLGTIANSNYPTALSMHMNAAQSAQSGTPLNPRSLSTDLDGNKSPMSAIQRINEATTAAREVLEAEIATLLDTPSGSCLRQEHSGNMSGRGTIVTIGTSVPSNDPAIHSDDQSSSNPSQHVQFDSPPIIHRNSHQFQALSSIRPYNTPPIFGVHLQQAESDAPVSLRSQDAYYGLQEQCRRVRECREPLEEEHDTSQSPPNQAPITQEWPQSQEHTRNRTVASDESTQTVAAPEMPIPATNCSQDEGAQAQPDEYSDDTSMNDGHSISNDARAGEANQEVIDLMNLPSTESSDEQENSSCSSDNTLFPEATDIKNCLGNNSEASSGLPAPSGLPQPSRHPSYSVIQRPANTSLVDEVVCLQESSDSEYNPPANLRSRSRSVGSSHSSLPYSQIYQGTSIVPSTASSGSEYTVPSVEFSDDSSDASISESTCRNYRAELRARLDSSPPIEQITTKSNNSPISTQNAKCNDDNRAPVPQQDSIGSSDSDSTHHQQRIQTTNGYIDSDGIENIGKSSSSSESSSESKHDERTIDRLISEGIVSTHQTSRASSNSRESSSSIESWERENSGTRIEEKVQAKEAQLGQAPNEDSECRHASEAMSTSEGSIAADPSESAPCGHPRKLKHIENMTINTGSIELLPNSAVRMAVSAKTAIMDAPQAQMNESREPAERSKTPLASTSKQKYNPRITRSMKRASRRRR